MGFADNAVPRPSGLSSEWGLQIDNPCRTEFRLTRSKHSADPIPARQPARTVFLAFPPALSAAAGRELSESKGPSGSFLVESLIIRNAPKPFAFTKKKFLIDSPSGPIYNLGEHF